MTKALQAVEAVSQQGNNIVLHPRTEGMRPIVVVLGMHRSGTSLCSHVLSALGVKMANEVQAADDNKHGHWERWEIAGMHDEIFQLLDRAYFSPMHDLPMPTAWWALPSVQAVRSRIEVFLKQLMTDDSLLGFKDPRTARLMPMWHQIFRSLNLSPKFVLCLRSPAQVARSLKVRDGLDTDVGEYRWLSYSVDCFRYTTGHDVCLMNYESWFETPVENLERLMTFLDVEWSQSDADFHALATGIVDRELRHTDDRLAVSNRPLVRSFFNLATGVGQDPSARAQIDHFVNHFVPFQQLLTTFEPRLRALAGVTAKLSQSEADVVALSTQIEARQTRADEKENDARLTAATLTSQLEAARSALGVRDEAAQTAEAAMAAAAAEHEATRSALRVRDEVAQTAEAALAAAAAEHEAVKASLASQTRQFEAALSDEIREKEDLSRDVATRTAELAASVEERDRLTLELQTYEQALQGANTLRAALSECLERSEADRRHLQQESDDLSRRLEGQVKQHAANLEESKSLSDRALADRLNLEESLRLLSEDFVGRSRELEARLELVSEEKDRVAADLQRMTVEVRQIDEAGTARAAALEAVHAVVLAENEKRSQSEINTLRHQLATAEAALAKSNLLGASAPVWATLAHTRRMRGAERQLISSGLFDERWYIGEYPTATEGRRSPVRHYLEEGYLCGCRPNPLFDTQWYLERYDDVRHSGVNPLVHYMTHGYQEGRDPGPDFQTSFYLLAYPEIGTLSMNPLVHYLLHGKAEGRLATSPHGRI